MNEIIPGILEQDWREVEKKVHLLQGHARTLHIDLIDGKFAQNQTLMDPSVFTKLKHEFTLELHMMVEEPIQYLKSFADAGFTRFWGHVEKMSDQVAFVALAQTLGDVGLALDGPTPVSAIKVPLEDLDGVLVYTSDKVGFSGSPFLPERLEKLRELRKKTDLPIEVDGGIRVESIREAQNAGATRFVCTSALFDADDPVKMYKKLLELLTAAN